MRADHSPETLAGVVGQFQILGQVQSITPYGEGHINKTYLVITDVRRYILQEMNTHVFPCTENLMENICRVTEHLQSRGRETLTVIPTREGKSYLSDGGKYRMYDFIEDTVSYQSAESEDIFRAAAEAFGYFQRDLDGFDASLLHEIIADFHHTPKRYEALERAIAEDRVGRVKECEAEIAFYRGRANTYGKVIEGLGNGSIPLRVTHNDTKLNNVLMDAEGGYGRAVIDLDTVMPGSLLYDFGDAIRFGASTAAEDEVDLEKVNFSKEKFLAYAKGYCDTLGTVMTQAERDLLAYGGYLMTAECGMRFLTDYLNGDVYFATKYPTHNLVRCHTQMRLAEQMWEQMDTLNEIVAGLF